MIHDVKAYVGCLLVGGGALGAQSPSTFVPGSTNVIELDHGGALDARFVDLDLDGDLDLITFFPSGIGGTQEPWMKFWENRLDEGLGFPEIPASQVLDDPTIVQPGSSFLQGPYDLCMVDVDSGFGTGGVRNDLDQDEIDDIDMVIGQQRQLDYILYFDSTTKRFTGKGSSSPELIAGSQTSDYLTDSDPGGAGIAWDPTCSSGPAWWHRWTVGMAAGNIDRDGNPDLVAVYRESNPRVYQGDPMSQNFVEREVLATFPDEGATSSASRQLKFPNVANRSVWLVDLDMDGDDDLIIARSSLVINPLIECAQAAPAASDLEGERLDSIRVYKNNWDDVENPPTTVFTPWYKLAPGCHDAQGNQHTGTWGAMNIEPGTSGPKKGSPSLNMYFAEIDGNPGLDLVVPVIHSPHTTISTMSSTLITELGIDPGEVENCVRDYRVRVYCNDGNGWLGVQDPAYVENNVARTIPSLWIGSPGVTGSGDNLKSAWVAVADFDGAISAGHYSPDILVAHNFEDSTIAENWDRLWMWSGPGAYVRETWPSGLDLGIAPQPVDLPVGCNVPNNDNTRYMRYADLDGDDDYDFVETSFLKVDLCDFNTAIPCPCPEGSVYAPNPRVFINRFIP